MSVRSQASYPAACEYGRRAGGTSLSMKAPMRLQPTRAAR